MKNSYQETLNWIANQKDIHFERLKNWISINSFSWNIQGLNELLKNVSCSFQKIGGELNTVQLPPQKRLKNSIFIEQPLACALMIKKRPQAPIQILLGGHHDTVYAPTETFQMDTSNPHRWIGPGVADMKGGLVVMLAALEAFERSPFAEKIGWEVMINPDEEIGSPGSSSLFKAAAYGKKFGLIFEPSFADGAYVHQRMGSATFSAIIKGKAAHVGRDYHLGKSAVFALGQFIHLLDLLRRETSLLINVSQVDSTMPVNIIPPLASCRINIRSSMQSHLEHGCLKIHELAKACEDEDIHIDLMKETIRMPKPFDSQTKELFDAYSNCARELDQPFKMRESGGVCDGNVLSLAGLPTLDTAGVIGGDLHTHHEYFICSSLVERAQLATLFLLKLANHEIGGIV